MKKLFLFLFCSAFGLSMQKQESKSIQDSRVGTAALCLYNQFSGEQEDVRQLILNELATTAELAGPEAEEKELKLSLKFLDKHGFKKDFEKVYNLWDGKVEKLLELLERLNLAKLVIKILGNNLERIINWKGDTTLTVASEQGYKSKIGRASCRERV